MDAWGPRIFEDDHTLDWYVHFCKKGSPVSSIRAAFRSVLQNDEFIDYGEGAAALAAAEIIAAALGHPSSDYPTNDLTLGPNDAPQYPDADLEALATKITPELLLSAVKAIDKVHTFDESELSSIWDGDDDRAAVMRGLKLRLKQAG